MTRSLTADYKQDRLLDWLKGEQERLATQPKTLFAIAYQRYRHGTWESLLEYVHAEDAQRAKVAWAAGVKGLKFGINAQFIGVAPVVGVFVEDEKKEIYSV